MADNKNQHFVPRVHLRPFTVNGEGLAINLFNLDRMRAIPNAPVRNQCSGDYFYGHNKLLENAINFVEDPYGPIVNHLSDGGAVGSAVKVVMKRFIYLQYLRTEAASLKASEMVLALQDVPGADLPVPTVKEASKEAVQAAMVNYKDTMRIVDDLKLCIVRNRTDLPFFTSDDPSILTNRLYIQRPRNGRPSFGVKAAGAIFFLPLSPSLFAILYDGAVYTSSHRAHWIDINRHQDIEALNAHQVLGCWANVYFREWGDRDKIASQVEAAKPRRPTTRQTITQAVLEKSDDWGEYYAVRKPTDIRSGEKVLVHVATNHPTPSTWPSFLRFRTDAHAYSNNTGAGLTRRWCLEQGFVQGSGYRKVSV
jgi:hypothetical protein